MADTPSTQNQAPPAAGAPQQKGEGSYEGARDYKDRTEKFLDEKGDQVEQLARDAAGALSGSATDYLLSGSVRP